MTRMLVAYGVLVIFALGFVTCRIVDSRRIERVVADYTTQADLLRERLMELEKR